MNKLKVLHIIPSLVKGGAERLVLDICNELSKRDDIDFKLLNFREENDYRYLSKNVNRVIIDTYVIPSITSKDKIKVSDYIEFVQTFKPQIIHSHLFEAEIVSREVIFPEVMYVTHLHDNMPQFKNLSFETFFNKKRLTSYYEKQRLLKRYKKCNNHFIAISKDTYDYYIKYLPLDLHNITLMHNAIDFERFKRRGTVLNRITPIDEMIRLITVGSLVDKKNQIFLVDVVKILTDKGLIAHLDILGDGPNRNKIQEKINNYGLHDRITLHGNVNHVEEYLHKSYIYVHSAIYEPFGLVLLEAMAAGLPVIALDGRGNRDFMVSGENGFLISEPDADRFAEKVIELAKNAELYTTITKQAVLTGKKYDISTYVERLMEYYRRILLEKI